MSDRVTMQDIADALGLSRNTVSKAINNTGVIAPGTRELILKKAVEMGYRQLAYPLFFPLPDLSTDTSSVSAAPAVDVDHSAGPSGQVMAGTGPVTGGQGNTAAAGSRSEIAMVTASIPGGSHFAVTTIDRMQQIFSSLGYSLAIYRVLPAEISSLKLPGSMNLSHTAAIFCLELFNYEYCRMLSSIGLPLLMIDAPASFDREPLSADILLMENFSGIFSFLKQMSEQGKKTVGFIGNMMHCRSFFERGTACISAAACYGFEPVQPYSILDYPPGKNPARIADYTDDISRLLGEMPTIPQIFICANDFLAINVISSLRRMGIQCPGDILVLGFDDAPESRYHAPALSTVHIHTQSMGTVAAELLLSRISNNLREYRTTYVPTDLILRESTQA